MLMLSRQDSLCFIYYVNIKKALKPLPFFLKALACFKIFVAVIHLWSWCDFILKCRRVSFDLKEVTTSRGEITIEICFTYIITCYWFSNIFSNIWHFPEISQATNRINWTKLHISPGTFLRNEMAGSATLKIFYIQNKPYGRKWKFC